MMDLASPSFSAKEDDMNRQM
ncbi:MAG: hypothetical protein FD129_2815, partial [bacterium]